MNVIFIFANQFPIGGAGANRIITIGKALQGGGNSFKVFLIRPTEDSNNIINDKVKGTFEEIEYEFLSGTNIWKPSSRPKRFFLIIKGTVRAIYKMHQINKVKKIDFIISGFDYTYLNIIFHLFAKVFKIKYLYNIDEFPWRLIHPEDYNKLFSKFYEKLFYKLFDGMIIMTKPLIDYYKTRGRKNLKIFHFPMTVDPDRFQEIEIKQKETTDIVYTGSMSIYKDGIDILAEAFCKIKNIFPSIRLRLIGPLNDEKSIEVIRKIINKNKAEDRIEITGEVDRDLIPAILCNSNVLVLARPNNIQAEGGFPTKLGEYLMSGCPVIVTKVGEIPKYLQDRETAFLAEPGDIDSFSDKLKEVILNENLAQRVGLNGKELAMRVFNYKEYSEKLNTFLANEF